MSKYKVYDEKIRDVLLSDITMYGKWNRVATKVLNDDATPIEVDNLRSYIKRNIQSIFGLDSDLYNETDTSTNQYEVFNALSALKPNGTLMTIQEYCSHYGLNFKDVRTYKLVTHTGTPYYNIASNDVSEEIEKSIDFEKIISKHLKNEVVLDKIKTPKTEITDRLIWSDVHVGMDTNKSGYAMYGVLWNKIVLMNQIKVVVNTILSEKRSNVLIIDELGDFMDGWDGETVRKGHSLPQNMDNEEAFDTGIEAKMYLISELSKHYVKIICHNICEDNHAGSFGYIVNSAFKQICDVRFNNVEVINYRKFMNHYFIGKHAKIICHGKDSKNLKFGFKPKIDPIQIEKIDQYLKQSYIYNQARYIEFAKGDSHQALFDYSSSDDFDYINAPAFSPSSEWVQTNFKKGRRGFIFQHIYNEINRNDTKLIWF